MIENMKVRRFKEEDAQEVRNLIVRNFLEVNSKDYGISAMEKLAKVYDVEKVLNVASYAHMYVFEFDGKIIGTGSISSFWGSETESILLSIFVLPEFHGKGVGRKIINTLETDRTEGKANTGAEPAVLEGAYPDEKELKAIRKSLNICTVVMGVCTLGIGLLWCIPIRKKILNRIDRREPVSNGLKIAATWVGMIPGLLLLVNEDI